MEKVTLAEFVKVNGQAKAANVIGVHQTAISKALRVSRNIYVITSPTGKVEAEEVRPFPSGKHESA
ncbi:Cro/CI family transcriptional regulator [Kluyvera genomosp. 1]|uniref:Cro/CI family transcriptional regulator n=1 Tax=Kluyvera genomosp. 1 TaxID=2774053 RepID=UPI000690BDED|nr:Cro/CI family transcriptional regulator [Kluyvera genomosp. 1]